MDYQVPATLQFLLGIDVPYWDFVFPEESIKVSVRSHVQIDPDDHHGVPELLLNNCPSIEMRSIQSDNRTLLLLTGLLYRD
jgi:hypothetical protein